MKKKTKSLLSLALAVFMLLSFAPLAHADEAELEAEPAPIYTKEIKIEVKEKGPEGAELKLEPKDESIVTGSVNAGEQSATAKVLADVDIDLSSDKKDAKATGITVKDEAKGWTATVVAGEVDVSVEATKNDGKAEATGLTVEAKKEEAKVLVELEDVTATADSKGEKADATAVSVKAEGKGDTVAVAVEGDVTAKASEAKEAPNAEASATGIEILAKGEKTQVIVAVEADKTGVTATAEGKNATAYGIDSKAEKKTEVDIAVLGDVYGDTAGVRLLGEGTQKVIIDGTVSGDKAFVIADKEEPAAPGGPGGGPANPPAGGPAAGGPAGPEARDPAFFSNGSELVVWKIEEQTAPDEAMLKNLNSLVDYIVRLTQPTAGATAALEGTTEKYKFDTAKQSDTVTIKLNVQEGYEVLRVYNKENNEAIVVEKRSADEYFLVVPYGGGIDLAVEVQKLAQPKADNAAKPKPTRAVLLQLTLELDEGKLAVLTFYKDGGFIFDIDGVQESGTFRVKDGKLVVRNAAGVEAEIAEDEAGGKLVFQLTGDPDKSVEFVFDAESVAILKTV